MTASTANIRKAAVLIRSLDADTAAGLLARLSPSEAREVRMAIQSLGDVDDDERADVSAEFRRTAPLATEDPRQGVALEVSSIAGREPDTAVNRATSRPFEFLEQASVESLVPYLSREHGQTVAVVLSYLAPARAANVLAALPERLQAEAVERLAALGDTDPNSLQVLESELADWVARQQATRTRLTNRIDTVAAILAAADSKARDGILANLHKHNHDLARQFAPVAPKKIVQVASVAPSKPASTVRPVPPSPRLPQLHIDDMARMDNAALGAVLRAVDAEVLTLALVGANEALLNRITCEMPRKVAKAFRQRLNCLGPTRLRDVEAAQQEVAATAARVILARRNGGAVEA